MRYKRQIMETIEFIESKVGIIDRMINGRIPQDEKLAIDSMVALKEKLDSLRDMLSLEDTYV